MIEATGAKCTSYFTKHNHTLVCRRLVFLMHSLHKGPKMYKIPSCACIIYYSYYTDRWEEFVWGIYDALNLKLSPWIADSCSSVEVILDLSWNLQVPTLFTRACHIPGLSNMLQLTPCHKVLLEKPAVVQQVKKLSTCVTSTHSPFCAQDSTTNMCHVHDVIYMYRILHL